MGATTVVVPLFAALTLSLLIVVMALLAAGTWDGTGRMWGVLLALTVCVVGLAAYSNEQAKVSFRERDTMAMLALASTLAALVTITWNGIRIAPGLALCDALLVLTALLLAIRLLAGHDIALSVPGWAIVPGYVLLVTGLVYALYSGQIIVNALPALRFAVALTLTPIVLAASGYTLRRRDLLIEAWLLGAVINCLVALADFFGFTNLGELLTGSDYSRVERFSGLAFHPNHLAIAAAMAIPVVMSRFSRASGSGRRRGYVIYSVWSVALVLGLLLSGSRTGLVVGVCAAVAMAVFPLRDRSAGVRSVVLVATALLILTIAVTNLAGDRNLFIGADRILQPASGEVASNTGRKEPLAVAVSAFGSHPLIGTGFSQVRSALNIYLQLLQAAGILGLAAFITAIGGAIIVCVRLARDALLSISDRHGAAAIAISLMAWMAFGLFQNAIYDRFLYVPIGFALAILAAAERLRRASSLPDARRASSA